MDFHKFDLHFDVTALRNSWSDALFEGAGYNFKEEHVQRHSKETKQKMIEQLLLMNTSTANEIIAWLRSEMEV